MQPTMAQAQAGYQEYLRKNPGARERVKLAEQQLSRLKRPMPPGRASVLEEAETVARQRWERQPQVVRAKTARERLEEHLDQVARETGHDAYYVRYMFAAELHRMAEEIGRQRPWLGPVLSFDAACRLLLARV